MSYNNVFLEGRVVQLKRFPDQTFIMNYGWFEYDNQRKNGWYFKSVSGNIVLPIFPSDLTDMVVVDWNDSYHTPDIPAKIISGEVNKDDIENPAFISVETLIDRNNLLSYDVPNGRIVRVDELDKYFMLDKGSLSWLEVDFSSLSDLWSVSSLSNSEESDGD